MGKKSTAKIKALSEKKIAKVREYQEYMRRSQTPEVMGGLTAVLGTFQAISHYTMQVQGDLLPVQRKNIMRIQEKLKPELLRMDTAEDNNEFYFDVITDLVNAIEKAHKDLTEYYKTREDA
tara:strand:+ start:8081 stop:8443 length:363 start_codon:yes stop_codon:yes gene_type:complete